MYKNLTVEIIDKTPDDALLQVVFCNLCDKFPKDYAKMLETFLSFTRAQQSIYIICCWKNEVNNGGFNQYFFNSSGRFAPLLPDALTLIGADKFSSLAAKANETYKAEEEKITRHQDGTLEGFSKSYQDNPLNVFDREFFNLEKLENLEQLQVAFIHKNKTEFISS